MKCKYCNKDFPETNFEITATIGNKQYRRLRCRRCRQDSKNELRQRNARFVQRVKRRMKCSKCGMNNPICLVFHHPNKDKKETVSNLTKVSIRAIKNEIRKCIILCSNCHLIEHNGT